MPVGAIGAATFLGLEDTPATYAGSGGYIVQVNAGATALEFSTTPALTSLGLTGALPAPPVANRLYKDNIVKAWIQFNGTGVIGIQDSFNVSGIIDNGVGDYTITWDTDFANNDYAIAGFAATAGAVIVISDDISTSLAVGTAHIETRNTPDGVQADTAIICVIAIGDQ